MYTILIKNSRGLDNFLFTFLILKVNDNFLNHWHLVWEVTQILLNRRKILEGKDKISYEEAIEKEFKIYREREMKVLQSDFDLLIKSLPNVEGK